MIRKEILVVLTMIREGILQNTLAAIKTEEINHAKIKYSDLFQKIFWLVGNYFTNAC